MLVYDQYWRPWSCRSKVCHVGPSMKWRGYVFHWILQNFVAICLPKTQH